MNYEKDKGTDYEATTWSESTLNHNIYELIMITQPKILFHIMRKIFPGNLPPLREFLKKSQILNSSLFTETPGVLERYN
jgi:hypothetical protein